MIEWLNWQHRDADDAKWLGVPEPEKPVELVLFEELGCYGNPLPISGGYLNQPHSLMQDLRVVRTAKEHWEWAQRYKAEHADQYERIGQQFQSRLPYGSA